MGQCSTATACYVYDAEGHRVRATVNGQTRDFVYDLSGRNIDEFTPGRSGWLGTWTRGEAYAGSLHIATYANSTTQFDNSDWLSTFRARSDINGNKVESCSSLPFGEDLTCTGTEVTPIHFTGKERDAESGNDFFGARYYTSTMGRFLTPDWAEKPTNVPYAHFGNPQSLNLYGYVNNNPTTVGDPDGHIGGVDDAVEVLLLGGTVTVMAMQAYFAMPASQRNLGASFSQAADSVGSTIRSWFQSSDSSKTGVQAGSQPKDVYIDPNKYPASAGHVADAQAAGHPDVLTVDRSGASDRRADATAGHATQPGTDRDEYPPAVTREGGTGASVQNIPSSDNRGSGASLGNQISDVPNGGQIRVVPQPAPPPPEPQPQDD
jgi:RHS repeat-associated protein